MGKIMLDTSFPNSPAWLEEGGAYAMALHLGALAYSDAHGLDGIIPERVVPHVSLAVSPGDIPDAVRILLDFGFWTKMSRDKYAIQEYERTNFTKAQAEEFREREAVKKRRQRLHSAGDHSLCTSARWCPAVKEREEMSRGDTRGTSPGQSKRDTRGSIQYQSIPLNSIRPQGSMDVDGTGNGRRRRGPALASAGAPAAASPEGSRRFQGVTVTPDMIGGQDPNALDEIALENALVDYYYPGEAAGADPADGLQGIVQAGGAGG